MSRRLGRDTITLTTPGDKSVHGATVDDWEHPASVRDVKGCYVEIGLSDEQLEHRDSTRAAGTVAAPNGTVVTFRDKVTFAGTDYLVDGRALEGHSFSGRLDYVEIPINRWEG